jgi:hypothetical protein
MNWFLVIFTLAEAVVRDYTVIKIIFQNNVYPTLPFVIPQRKDNILHAVLYYNTD